jgi:putative spermidine/putrescine transport system permease protein
MQRRSGVLTSTLTAGASSDERARGRVLWQVAPAALLVLLFLVAPLAILVRVSLYATETSFSAAGGWSLRHFGRVLGNPLYLGILGETVVYGLIGALASLLIGFPVGYALARASPQARRWRLAVIILPLTLSLVVNVFGWLVILGGTGLVNHLLIGLGLIGAPLKLLYSREAVLVVLVHTFLPFQVLSIMSVVAQIEPALEEAAASLRANRWTTFRRVILPLAWPGIVSGSTLVFILTVSAFVTPRLVGGPRVQMLGSVIYEQVLAGLNWPFGAAMSLVLLALVLVLIGLSSVARLGTAARAP